MNSIGIFFKLKIYYNLLHFEKYLTYFTKFKKICKSFFVTMEMAKGVWVCSRKSELFWTKQAI